MQFEKSFKKLLLGLGDIVQLLEKKYLKQLLTFSLRNSGKTTELI